MSDDDTADPSQRFHRLAASTPRVDGPLKVSGMAQYTSDFHFPGHALCRSGRSDDRQRPSGQARHRRGRENARRARDFSSREHRQDFPLDARTRVSTASATSDARRSRTMWFATTASTSRSPWRTHSRPPRPLPMRFASTYDQRKTERRDRSQSRRRARSGCDHVRPWPTDCKASAAMPRPRSQARRVKLDQTYVTPTETHNPLELHATTAIWDGSNLTLYESTQGVVNFRGVLAQMFGLPKENVRVITKFLGSGFGGKLCPWTHCPLAAAAARQLGQAGQTRASAAR